MYMTTRARMSSIIELIEPELSETNQYQTWPNTYARKGVSMYYMAENRKNFTLFKRFKRLQTPQNTPKNASSNFSNFRNYPNYFRFPIYKFISQKIFSSFISHDQHDERYKN